MLDALIIFLNVLTVFGFVIFISVFGLRAKLPADESNRINKFRLFWFSLTRGDEFVGALDWITTDNVNSRLVRARLLFTAVYQPHKLVDRFNWLMHDELDNVTK